METGWAHNPLTVAFHHHETDSVITKDGPDPDSRAKQNTKLRGKIELKASVCFAFFFSKMGGRRKGPIKYWDVIYKGLRGFIGVQSLTSPALRWLHYLLIPFSL